MKIKEKPCKGTGKAKGLGCGKISLVRTYGLGVVCGCYRDWLLNTKEGKEKLSKLSIKVSESRINLEKATKEKKNRKGIQTSLNTTKTVVHEMIRLRDEGKPCASCGCQWKEDFQAGHCYSSNNYRSIRFDFFNINGQCCKCNLSKDGNEVEYLLRLPSRIGNEEFENLRQRALDDKKEVKKWDKEELKEIRNKARLIIKQLQK